jgi:hypothetical protein
MKKAMITGAVTLCVLLASATAAFAAGGGAGLPVREGLSFGDGTFRAGIEERMGTIQEKMAGVKEKAGNMSAYEQYGLVYDESKGGYCYGDKLVGLLVDPQGRGISYLNKNGEVHVKAIRNENGEITGLAELSEDEYNKVVTELDGMKSDMQEHMNEMRKKMQERFQSGTFAPGNFEWGANGIHESMQERMNQMRSEMEQRLNDIMNNIK